jgi:hypothetical protein
VEEERKAEEERLAEANRRRIAEEKAKEEEKKTESGESVCRRVMEKGLGSAALRQKASAAVDAVVILGGQHPNALSALLAVAVAMFTEQLYGDAATIVDEVVFGRTARFGSDAAETLQARKWRERIDSLI